MTAAIIDGAKIAAADRARTTERVSGILLQLPLPRGLDRHSLGIRGLITAAHVKPGAAVIDVGIHRTGNGLTGDVAFPEAAEVAAWITPVPGGVGPMTIATLLSSTITAAELAVEPAN